MDNLLSMQVFCAVAELRSFSAAANRLALSPAMVSKHVAHLERRLGTRLLHRNSRHVSLSEAGGAYFDQVGKMLAELQKIETTVATATAQPSGQLRLTAPVWLANPSFARVLADFHEQFPDVHVEVDLTGKLMNLVDERYDLALRATTNLDPGLVGRRLTEVRFELVAAPAYLQRTGRPSSLHDLNGRAFLAYSGFATNGTVYFRDRDHIARFRTVLSSGNEAMLRLAALNGMGLTFLPTQLSHDDIGQGRLERVLPDETSFSQDLHCIYLSRSYLPAKVRTFVDFISQHPVFTSKTERQAKPGSEVRRESEVA